MPRVETFHTGEPCWVDLSTSDPDDAVRFYTTVFGWDHEAMPSRTDEPYHMFSSAGLRVAACMRQPADVTAAGARPAWMTYLAGDADAVAAAVPDAGGTVLMPPTDIEGSGRMAIVAEPCGAMFGVWQAGGHGGAEVIDEPGALTWNEVNTPDMAATARFLEMVFGVRTADLEASEFSGYRTFAAGQRPPRGGVLQMTAEWEGVPPHWMTYFAVDDTDATCTAVADAGGTVSIPPFDSAAGRLAVVDDPQGAVFMVRSRPA